MQGGIVAAQVVITGKDDTGAAFSSIKGKIEAVEKQLNQVGKAADLAARLKQVNDQLASIDKLRGSEQRLAGLSQRYSEARTAAEKTAAAYKAAEKPTVALERAMDRAAQSASRAGAAYFSQLDKVEALRRGLDGAGLSVNRLAAEEARLRRDIEATTAAMTRQARVEAQHAERRQARQAIGGMLGIGAAHAAEHFARQSFETYREFDMQRRWGKAVMGLSDEDQQDLVQQAIRGGGTTKFNDIKWLETQRELAGRGLTKDQVLGITPTAAIMAQALGGDMSEAARMIEGSMFGFDRDRSTREAATAAARRTADLQVRAAKASGMTREDLMQLYKYGATPARLGGLSEESLLAFGAMSKRSNIGGDESGVAFRALMKNLYAPTREAKVAMLAHGINFANYQKAPGRMEVAPFVSAVAQQYGVQLSRGAQAGLGRIFADPSLIGDPAKFTPAVMRYLHGQLHGNDAKSLRSIAGLANTYRNQAMSGVDANGLLAALIPRLGNLQFANAMFGSKQGGRIAAAFNDPSTLAMLRELLTEHAEGKAQQISDERMAGFDGAVSRFEGAVKNLETAALRAWDDGGKGGPLTWVVDRAAKLAQSLTEVDGSAVRVITGMGGLAAALAGAKGLNLLFTGFGLKGSAEALTAAAGELTMAARMQRGVGGVPGVIPAGESGKPLTGPGLGRILPFGLNSAMIAYDVATADADVNPEKSRGIWNSWFGSTWLRDDTKDNESWLANRIKEVTGWGTIGSDTKDILRTRGIESSYGSGRLDVGGAGGLGHDIEATLAELRSSARELDLSGRLDITGKIDVGEGTIIVRAAPGTEVVHTNSSGNIKLVPGGGATGHSSPDAMPGGRGN